MAGSVAATLQWPNDDPVTGLAEAIVAAVKRSGFTGLREPLWVWNLKLLKPGSDATSLALGDDAPSLHEQFGLEDPRKQQKIQL